MQKNLPVDELKQIINDTKESFNTDNPIVPFIEGDGIEVDIRTPSQQVFDAAVSKAYDNERKVKWSEVMAGQKSFDATGEWLPESTIQAVNEHKVGIKGPLTTPVGGGIRSLNVAIRQKLDLYVCLRPMKWFKGVITPTKKPEDVDMVLFRENTEDVYAGKELEASSKEAKKLNEFLKY